MGTCRRLILSLREAGPEKRITFTKPECDITWHVARRHSLRDIEIYRMLAEDIESGQKKYTNSKGPERIV